MSLDDSHIDVIFVADYSLFRVAKIVLWHMHTEEEVHASINHGMALVDSSYNSFLFLRCSAPIARLDMRTSTNMGVGGRHKECGCKFEKGIWVTSNTCVLYWCSLVPCSAKFYDSIAESEKEKP